MNNLYRIEIELEGHSSIMGVRAKNKVEAINKGMDMLNGWRNKDRITSVYITEDAGNKELTLEDYL